jgi:uncharacterized protein YcnI
MRTPLRRFAVLFAGATGVLLLANPAALAHVTVTSTDATPGGFAVLTFQIPTESAKASTTKVTVALPTAHPIAVVSVQPHPGWSFSVHHTRLAKPVQSDDGPIREVVDQIAWRADSPASAIKPGEFDQFTISAGPLPHVASLTFRTLQGYSDGSVVRWVEVAAPGSSAEPEHPAPVLRLAAGGGPSVTAGGSTSSSPAGEDDGGVEFATILGVIAILLAGAALVTALRRRSAR